MIHLFESEATEGNRLRGRRLTGGERLLLCLMGAWPNRHNTFAGSGIDQQANWGLKTGHGQVYFVFEAFFRWKRNLLARTFSRIRGLEPAGKKIESRVWMPSGTGKRRVGQEVR